MQGAAQGGGDGDVGRVEQAVASVYPQTRLHLHLGSRGLHPTAIGLDGTASFCGCVERALD